LTALSFLTTAVLLYCCTADYCCTQQYPAVPSSTHLKQSLTASMRATTCA
jgi:hypothetical protein